MNRKTKLIDAILINQKYISLHLSDIGVNAKIVQRFEEDNVRGFLGYGKHLIKELHTAKPLRFTLFVNEKKYV